MYILKEIGQYSFDLFSKKKDDSVAFEERYGTEFMLRERQYRNLYFFPFNPIKLRNVNYKDLEEIHFADGSVEEINGIRRNLYQALWNYYGIKHSVEYVDYNNGPFYLSCGLTGRFVPMYFYFNYLDLLNNDIRKYDQYQIDDIYFELNSRANDNLILPKEFFDLSMPDEQRFSITLEKLSKKGVLTRKNVRHGQIKYKPIKNRLVYE